MVPDTLGKFRLWLPIFVSESPSVVSDNAFRIPFLRLFYDAVRKYSLISQGPRKLFTGVLRV